LYGEFADLLRSGESLFQLVANLGISQPLVDGLRTRHKPEVTLSRLRIVRELSAAGASQHKTDGEKSD
jgi:hypothetical protein